MTEATKNLKSGRMRRQLQVPVGPWQGGEFHEPQQLGGSLPRLHSCVAGREERAPTTCPTHASPSMCSWDTLAKPPVPGLEPRGAPGLAGL